MSKFHIDVRTPSHIGGTVTVERDDHTALRIEISRYVAQLLRDHAGEIWADEEWQIDVTDESGLILYVLNVSAYRAPAVTGPTRPTYGA
ncbi:DUF6894 family protein [Sphingomonas sp. IC4-52]|uniref:DUF6894 family protein n=1 Tax=Sphingomonas sp. IC4-52 TaxID=2887202 RepID=UPI001D11344C|nr:hypothetical protein [Sphingomonas sp. IC4-52]MCC2979054.1 hypothetical protein [Sphingomonas sp. IC4-52]